MPRPAAWVASPAACAIAVLELLLETHGHPGTYSGPGWPSRLHARADKQHQGTLPTMRSLKRRDNQAFTTGRCCEAWHHDLTATLANVADESPRLLMSTRSAEGSRMFLTGSGGHFSLATAGEETPRPLVPARPGTQLPPPWHSLSREFCVRRRSLTAFRRRRFRDGRMIDKSSGRPGVPRRTRQPFAPLRSTHSTQPFNAAPVLSCCPLVAHHVPLRLAKSRRHPAPPMCSPTSQVRPSFSSAGSALRESEALLSMLFIRPAPLHP